MKKTYCFKIFALTCCFVLLMHSVVNAGILGVRRFEQKKSKWCWAASAQMIGNYLGYPKTQTAICKAVKGNTDDNSASADEVVEALDAATNYEWNPNVKGVLSRLELEQYFDGKIPLGMSIGWFSGGGHCVVLGGYRGTKIQVIDPLPNCGTTMHEYVSMVNGDKFESGNGFYRRTYTFD